MPGMLDQLLQQSSPGINPELEKMIANLMLGAGNSPGRAQGSAAAASRMPLPQQSPLGLQRPTGGQAPEQGGLGGGEAPAAANETYQILIQAGVPPELALQAIGNPQLMQTLIMQIQGGMGPQEAPIMQTSGTPAAPSAPPPANYARPR